MTAPAAPIHVGGMTVTFTIDAEASGGRVTAFACAVPGGSGMPVAHSHDGFDETIHGLEGTATFTVDGTDIRIGPGDGLCIPRGAVHSFMALEGDTTFLAVITPGVFGPDYFREIGAILEASAGGPPDPAAIGAVMARHGLTPA